MPPKSITAVKGQKSLFSFFNKPPTTINPVTPTAEVRSNAEKNTEKQTRDIESQLVPVKRSRLVVADDEDEESSPPNVKIQSKLSDDIKSSPSPVKEASEDKEDEWDGKSFAEADDDYESEEAELSTSSSDEELFDSDDDEDESTNRKTKKRPRSRLQKKNEKKVSKPTSKKSTNPPSSSPPRREVVTPSHSASKHKSHRVDGTGTASSTKTPSKLNATPSSCAVVSGMDTPYASNPLLSGISASPLSGACVTPGAGAFLPEGVLGLGSHEHHSWEFLKPAQRKDKNMKKMTDPSYNPRTLHVPESFLKSQTPAMAQWWKFKSENMDTVLFFKVGKFYELFHMDADVGMSELDLIYMKGPKAHSGFPEISYGKYSSALVTKGYRVARVEQTETPEMLKDRNDANGGKKDKVVARELCSVLSKGTRTYCHLDDLSLLEGDEPGAGDGSAGRSVLICVKERLSFLPNDDDDGDDEGHDDGGKGGNGVDGSAAVSSRGQTLVPEYGVCIVDTVIGAVTLAQFQDDSQRSRLRTLLARHTPSEVLLEGGEGCCSAETKGVLRLLAPRAAVDVLRGSEMPSADDTIESLHCGQYFTPPTPVTAGSDAGSGKNKAKGSSRVRGGVDREDVSAWPPIMRAVLGGVGDGSSDLVVCALGGALWQLKRSLIDFEILSLRRVFAYIPPDDEAPPSSSSSTSACADPSGSSHADGQGDHHGAGAEVPSFASAVRQMSSSQGSVDMSVDDNAVADGEGMPKGEAEEEEPKSMTMDAIALSNLEILQNNFDQSSKGSLWAFINKCKTPFGQRLLREWLCHPLFRPVDIARRSQAVEELLSALSGHAEEARKVLRGVPDLERLLCRVHSNGLRKKGPVDHPDSRAVLYECAVYDSKKIRDFADVLGGFESVLKATDVFASAEMTSSLLRKVLLSRPKGGPGASGPGAESAGGRFPAQEMRDLLKYYRQIFDEKQAKKDGCIRPKPGVDPEYDQAKADIAHIEGELDDYLREMKRTTGIQDMKYWGNNKDRFQIEVPISASSKVPSNWTSKSQKKTHRRYWTSFIEKSLAALQDAEERLSSASKDTLRRVFERFDNHRDVWSDALACAATLDALLSLAAVSASPNYTWAEVLPRRSASGPQLTIHGGRHPMLEHAFAQRGEGDYIPNTVMLGGTFTTEGSSHAHEYRPKLLLLSGPNMGGKSTLLRQTCLIAILAQLGCKVPADSCVMTPVDRIYTRVGASDRILAGQSTFFVELAETATILRTATKDSLCILDELGRGTATFDGTAIAHAVMEHLVRATRCRSLFATHYHTLVQDWEMDPRVHLGHMDCIVQTAAAGSQGGDDDGNDTAMVEGSEEGGGEEVTFLYRLCDGSSPRSYGINVAKLARLPSEVLALAHRQSLEFEEKMKAASAGPEYGSASSMQCPSSTQGSSLVMSRKQRVVSFFEKLVSVTRSDMPLDEFAFVAAELWNRFKLDY